MYVCTNSEVGKATRISVEMTEFPQEPIRINLMGITGTVSVYVDQATAETLAFHLNALVQEIMTESVDVSQ